VSAIGGQCFLLGTLSASVRAGGLGMLMIFDYIKQGIRYLFEAVIAATILICIFRAVFKGKQITYRKFLKWLIVISYFLATGFIVFRNRNQYGLMDKFRFKYNLYLFENLRIAIRERSADTIIQTTLNFLMFIPSGGILLWIVGKARWKRVFVFIPLISFAVEAVQFITGWGLFDVDDLFCNTLGGYYGTFLFLTLAQKNKWNFIATISASALIIGTCFFYYCMPFGLLPEDVINYRHVKPDIVVIKPESFSQQPLAVYRTIKKEKEDSLPQIEAIFEATGSAVDYRTKDEYDSCVIYRGMIPTYYLWYNFDGSFQLNLGQKGIPLADEMTTIKSVLLLLSNMGYCLPDNCEVETPVDGKCKISFHMEEYNGSIYDGSLEFNCSQNTLFFLSYSVKEIEYCQEKNTYTQLEIQKNLLRGLFSCSQSFNSDVCKMEVAEYSVEYKEDTKGYYRPVYYLSVTMDGQPVQIVTSAVSAFR